MIIYSYGGGEILYNIFQGVAKLHNGGFLQSIFSLGAIVGFLLITMKLFFTNEGPIELMRKWFLPLLFSHQGSG